MHDDIRAVIEGRSRYCVITADCLAVLPTIPAGSVGAVVSDVPYGMAYRSSMAGRFGDCEIQGDESTELRDAMLAWADGLPCLIFGNWRIARPLRTRAVLTWDKGPHVGMGALDIPWKPNTEEVYVIGRGFEGHRGTSVLRYDAVSPNFQHVAESREHPTQKPMSLMYELVSKCPPACLILDPFCGSGTTGVAAIKTGRRFIGIEIDPGYADIARRRIAEAVPTLFERPREPDPALFTDAPRAEE